jgi:hypothetical protein
VSIGGVPYDRQAAQEHRHRRGLLLFGDN